MSSYEFKDEPIQLVSIKDGILETTAEAINILTGLKNSKLIILSINGPVGSGKSTLANNLTNRKKSIFKIGEKTEGIWIWGKTIDIENEIERYSNNLDLSTKRDICSSNIILLF